MSLSAAAWTSSLPIAYRLYLPEAWAEDGRRRSKAGVPEPIAFEAKPQIALGRLRQAVEADVTRGAVRKAGTRGPGGLSGVL